MEAFIWLGLLLLFLAIEAGTVTLVSIWFAGGALTALLVSLFCPIFWVQAVVFLGVSGVLLLLLRPITKKYFTPKLTKTNVDAVIGTVKKGNSGGKRAELFNRFRGAICLRFYSSFCQFGAPL